MKNFSLLAAFTRSAAGGTVAAATGGVYAVWHHANGHFQTLGDAFSYAAQPANIAVATGLALTFGFGMELIRHYHKDVESKPAPAPRKTL